jgi:Cu(I)/Ag(I) efflux system membrane protein CusA/SilA
LLYLKFRRLTETLIVMASLPFALDARAVARVAYGIQLVVAVMSGAVERLRPKMMTVTAIIAGLLPIL